MDKVKMKDGTIKEIDWANITKEQIKEIDWDVLWEEGEPCPDPEDELPGEGKPYPNEHACRIEEPSKFQKGSFRRKEQKADGKTLWLIIGKLKGSTKTSLQAFRYPKDEWTESAARAHCKRHNGILFEPASNKSDAFDDSRYFYSVGSGRGEQPPEQLPEMQKMPELPDFDVDNDFEEYAKEMEHEEYIRTISERIYERGEFKFHSTITTARTVRGIEEEERIIEGYSNTKNIDRYNEIILPNAFRESLKRFIKTGVILTDHDAKKPIGRPKKAAIDKEGLWLRSLIEKGVQYIDEAWILIQKQLKKSYSVGFRVLDTEWKEVEGFKDKIRHITKLDLYEVSVVTIPANIQSVFNVVKGMVNGTDLFDTSQNRWINEGWTNESEDYSGTIDFVKRINKRIDGEAKETELIAKLKRFNERMKNKTE